MLLFVKKQTKGILPQSQASTQTIKRSISLKTFEKKDAIHAIHVHCSTVITKKPYSEDLYSWAIWHYLTLDVKEFQSQLLITIYECIFILLWIKKWQCNLWLFHFRVQSFRLQLVFLLFLYFFAFLGGTWEEKSQSHQPNSRRNQVCLWTCLDRVSA